MSIRARMIILPLSIVLNYFLTKTSGLTFIGCHNFRLQSCSMIGITSVHALSWHDNVRACAFTRFVPYPLCKFILTSSFSYLWLWNLSVLTSFHVLSAEYVRIRLVHLFSFFLRLHAVETFFVPFSFVSMLYPVLYPYVSTLYLIISPPVSMLDSVSSWFDLTLTTFPTVRRSNILWPDHARVLKKVEGKDN